MGDDPLLSHTSSDRGLTPLQAALPFLHKPKSFVRPPPLHHQAQGQSPGGDHPLPEPSLLNPAPPAPSAFPPPSVLGPPPLGHLCLDTGLSKPLLKFGVQKVHSSSGKDYHPLLARLAPTFVITDSVPLLSGLPRWPGPQHHAGVVHKGDAVSVPCFAPYFSVSAPGGLHWAIWWPRCPPCLRTAA